MERDIRAWCGVLRQYAYLKPYSQLQHLLGYLKNCEGLGELLPDPYIKQWRGVLRRLVARAEEEHQLALVSLYYELGQYDDRAVC